MSYEVLGMMGCDKGEGVGWRDGVGVRRRESWG